MPADRAVATPARRLHPMAIIGDFVRQLPQYVIAIVAGGSALLDGGIGVWLFLGGGAAAGLAAVIRWSFFRYTIGADGLLIESGVISKQRRSIGFDRVQDIEIERGLLARMTGTAHVRVETGGSSEDEGNLPSVSDRDALALRDSLRRWRESQGTPEQVNISNNASPNIFYRMPVGLVLRSGMYRFSFVFLAIFAAASQFFQPNEEDIVSLFGAEVEASLLSMIDDGLDLMLAIAIVGILLLLGFLSGIVVTVLRDFDFSLSGDHRGLTRKRGLLTRTEAAIPFGRIQAASLDNGPVRRRQDRADLAFQMLGSGKRSGGRQDAAPFAAQPDRTAVLAAAGYHTAQEPVAFHPARWVLIIRVAIRAFVAGAMLFTACYLLEPALWPGALCIALVLFISGIFAARREGFAIAVERLVLRQGWWRQRIWLVPFGSLQVAEMTRGPLQRLTDTATLHVDIAGAPTIRPARVRDISLAEAQRLMALLSQKVGRSAGVIQPSL